MDVLAVALAALAIVFSVIALRRTVRRPVASTHSQTLVAPDAAHRQQPSVDLPDSLYAAVTASLRHIAVVRYDAFDDVSGRQSFTAAILDDNGDGIVITSLHARTESRTLLKGVNAGHGDGLSPEERQAVDQARGAA